MLEKGTRDVKLTFVIILENPDAIDPSKAADEGTPAACDNEPRLQAAVWRVLRGALFASDSHVFNVVAL